MEDSVADISLRHKMSAPAKVGLALLFITYFVTKDVKQTLMIVFAHFIFHSIFK
jgi:hypothetical protein